MKNLGFILLFICLLFSGLQAQTTFYCAPTGDDNTGNGSLANPYRNLAHAVSMASSGDIIVLRQGSYPSPEVRISINNLTIKSYPNERATLVCPTNDDNYASAIWFDEPDVDGGLLENLEIIGGYYYGVKLESNWDWGVPANQRHGVKNITIKGCNIHDTGRDCIKITPGCDNINIVSCEIHHSGVGVSNDPNDPNAEGIDNVNSNMWVHNCYFHDISTTGLYAKGGANNCIIEENLIMNTGEGGILIGFYTDSDWFDEINNPDYYECINAVVRNNIIVNTGGAGIGFFGAKNCSAYNNTVITASPKFHSPLFFNAGEIWVTATDIKTPKNLNCTVRNNIFVDQSGTTEDDLTVEIREGSLSGNTTVINHNIYQKTTGAASFTDGIAWPNFTFAQWKSQMGFDMNGLEGNPMLNANYHLNTGSPCINAGYNMGANIRDYDGNTRQSMMDIGADEFNAGTSVVTPPPSGTIGTGVIAQMTDIHTKLDITPLKLYPNPAIDAITVEMPDNRIKNEVFILTTQGQMIAPRYETEGNNLKISLSGLAAGLYILSLNGQPQSFIIQ